MNTSGRAKAGEPKRCAATRDGHQCSKRAPHSGKHYALVVGYWGRGKEPDDGTGDGQLMRRMDEARALLLAHGLTLYGFDPGVTCFDDAGGRCLDFPGAEWQQFRRALVMLYGDVASMGALEAGHGLARLVRSMRDAAANGSTDEGSLRALAAKRCAAALGAWIEAGGAGGSQ